MSAELMQAFGFSADELAMNRSGQLSPRQLAQVEKQASRTKTTSVIFGLIFGAIAVYLLLPFIQALSLGAANLGRLIGGVVLLAFSLLLLSALVEKPKTPTVQSVTGKAQFVRRETDDLDADGTPIGTSVHYYLVIQEHEFSVKREKYEAFNQGHVYNVYFLNPQEGILSAEYVGPPSA